MFESSYDNSLAGGGDVAKADAVESGKVFVKQVSKPKQIGSRHRRATTLNAFLVFRATSCPKAFQLASQMEL